MLSGIITCALCAIYPQEIADGRRAKRSEVERQEEDKHMAALYEQVGPRAAGAVHDTLRGNQASGYGIWMVPLACNGW